VAPQDTKLLLETALPNRLHRGKVRDTYDLGGGLLLMIATDRISAFDVVMPNGIPGKGLLLSRMSAFWFGKTAHIVPNHLVAMADAPGAMPKGAPVGPLPPRIARHAMVVRRAKRVDVECIVRGYLAGSAWAEYKKQGTIFGQPAPKGLLEGHKFERPIFTPSTKAEAGHDENMSLKEVERMVGPKVTKELEEKSIAVYSFARDYAAQRGLVLADTKFEFGFVGDKLILIDELLTPDSSRFWDARGYKPGQSQPNFDKQFVRDWLLSTGWNREPPAPALPADIVEKTAVRYQEAYRRITGESIPKSE